jgi:cellulose synthase/poly-beta-1,6-N-acetylglucosamine synthase-like glycosyltransferase
VTVFAIIYSTISIILAVYALNSWVLSCLYLRHRRENIATPQLTSYPRVTIQLPIYNEAYVVERIIDAAVKLEYPQDKLQIQVLDDSIDDTTAIAAAKVDEYRRLGMDISLIHRDLRPGYKGGALKAAQRHVTGEYIAIFDADFVPPVDFLQRTIPFLAADSRLGFVQTRWGHLNPGYSWLTQAQTIALDGHFVVEQCARNRSGVFMNFNGTAGIWRKSCIEDAGNWQADTLSEDLDLSYRAQMKGWKGLLLPDVVAPAEVPPQLAAFKRQQFRWAKGSIQCLRKLGRPLLFSQASPAAKLEGLIHLSSYLVHPLMLLLTIFMLPLMMQANALHTPLAPLCIISLGPFFLYALALRSIYPEWWKRYRAMPVLAILGTGIALSNTKAICEAFLGVQNVFRRTPKFRVESKNDRWQDSAYRLPFDGLVIGEIVLAIYSFFTAFTAWHTGNVFALPFILLYAAGYAYVGCQGMRDAWADISDFFTGRKTNLSEAKTPAAQHQFISGR